MTTRTVRFSSLDGFSLEGRLAVPGGQPAGLAVLCHPYSLAGGSMSNAMLPLLQRALEAAGWAALRFNFRGVGRSEGSFDGGRGEVRDAAGALAFARGEVPDASIAVVGWSFGALVGLAAVLADAGVACYVGIAPPLAAGPSLDVPPLPARPRPVRALLICGSADPFCGAAELRALADLLSAEVRIIEGADHFFGDHHAELADAVVGFVAASGRRTGT